MLAHLEAPNLCAENAFNVRSPFASGQSIDGRAWLPKTRWLPKTSRRFAAYQSGFSHLIYSTNATSIAEELQERIV